jgi:hypothetical protein
LLMDVIRTPLDRSMVCVRWPVGKLQGVTRLIHAMLIEFLRSDSSNATLSDRNGASRRWLFVSEGSIGEVVPY